MNRNRTSARLGLLGAALLALAGCTAGDSGAPDETAPAAPAAAVPGLDTGSPALGARVDLAGLPTVAEAQAARGRRALLRESVAEADYEALVRLFDKGEQGRIALGVYQLSRVPDAAATLAARAPALGLAIEAPLESDRHVVAHAGSLELRVYRASGAEFLVDRGRFHSGKGGAVLPEEDYVARAEAHLRRRVSGGDRAGLFAHKIRRFKNFTSSYDGSEAPTEEVYQVAVSFDDSIDGIPVIGSGSKVAVHMTTSGEVISHESSLRAVSGRFGTITGATLLHPLEARRIAEARVRERGVDLAEYTVALAEIGYLRFGRFSVQSMVAPHYAFFFDPKPGVTGKRIVEDLPATVDPVILDALAKDRAEEEARKVDLASLSAPDDQRPAE